MQNLYTCEAVAKLIDRYIEADGCVTEIREGVLGYGDLILTAPNCKSAVIKEIVLNEWSSAHKIRMYNKLPAKYQKIVDMD